MLQSQQRGDQISAQEEKNCDSEAAWHAIGVGTGVGNEDDEEGESAQSIERRDVEVTVRGGRSGPRRYRCTNLGVG